MGKALDNACFKIRGQDCEYDNDTGIAFIIYPAKITVNTLGGSITLEYQGRVPQSETSIQEFFLSCLRIQSELEELAVKQRYQISD